MLEEAGQPSCALELVQFPGDGMKDILLQAVHPSPLALHQVPNTHNQVITLLQLPLCLQHHPLSLHQVPEVLLDDGEHHSLHLCAGLLPAGAL